MNFENEIKKVLKDGKLVIGDKSVKKALLNGQAKLVIVASNASESIKEDLKRFAELSKIKYYEYPESSKELGYTCAKPFQIASLVIIDEGSSNILKIE